MADALTTIGIALVDVLREGLVRLRPHARGILERVAEMAEPPEGLSIRSDDGATFTGLLVVDHNEVVMVLAARQDPTHSTRPVERPPLITPPSTSPQRPFYQRPLLDPEDPMWDREDPYGGRYK